MAKLLVIKANPKSTEESVGLTVGEVFLKAYKAANPNDQISEINLFDRYIPEIDKDMLAAWGDLGNGKGFADLTEDQQTKLTASAEILEEFLAQDKYVFITPLWNFSFPARMKSYLDALCVAGKTFKYTENGPQGLIEGKKALHIHSSGGIHGGAHAVGHMNDIMSFIGMKDMETLIIEGHAQMSDKADEIITQGKTKAEELAEGF